MSLRYLSLFSGIEAATTAWHPLGWELVAVSEIEPFPCAVLAHHHPQVPNLGDVTKITEEQIQSLGPIDVVVFGSPCQDLSNAGKRKGLIDENGNITRSGLFFTAINIFHWANKHCGARFALWENVPGAYSSNKGRDFAAVVSYMAGLDDLGVPDNGWGTEGCAIGDNGLLEWACLDARWFGVAQRRRRVFALLDTGDWSSRPPILLEPNSLRRDTPPSRETRKTITHDIAPSFTRSGRGVGQDPVVACFGGNNTSGSIGVSPALNANRGCHNPGDFEAGVLMVLEKPVSTLDASYARLQGCSGQDANHGHSHLIPVCVTGNVTHALKAEGFDGTGRGQPIAIAASMQVRRLLPVECEKLQGFPPGYTDIPYRGKPAADGPRYKALGNSMAVPVMHWIGKQIQNAVEYPNDLSDLA